MSEISANQCTSQPDVITECPACGNAEVYLFLSAPDRYHGRKQLYRLFQCKRCSLVWLADRPSPSDMAQHYGADYDRSVSEAGRSMDRWKLRRETLVRYKKAGAILDLGCSSGDFLATLGPGWQRHGIEMSDHVAAKARSREINVFVGDILDAPFAPSTFDAITCFHVFEHIFEPHKVLAKVAKWLKPGGVFYFLVPNIHSAGCRIFKSYWYALELPRHTFHFSPGSLSFLAKTNDLEVRSLETHREVFIEQSVYYLVGSVYERMGWERPALARAKAPGLAWRIVRKAFRLTALPLFSACASLVGDGESIHAVFQKPTAIDS